MRKITAIVIASLLASAAPAEVTDSATNGFTTVSETIVDAGRARVWTGALQIGGWWNSDHTISGDASRLSIDPTPQGCFCETLGEQAGVVHLTVTSVMPTVMLRMTGGLGPLGLRGVAGNMIWEFEDAEKGTRVRFSYAVGGYMDGGLDPVAGAVDTVIAEALRRLKSYVETGSPESGTVE
ncbi:MAG: ATPase [Proteobacteria bacterium]|nr:ATPase [Pseudomonadota bacterium]